MDGETKEEAMGATFFGNLLIQNEGNVQVTGGMMMVMGETEVKSGSQLTVGETGMFGKQVLLEDKSTGTFHGMSMFTDAGDEVDWIPGLWVRGGATARFYQLDTTDPDADPSSNVLGSLYVEGSHVEVEGTTFFYGSQLWLMNQSLLEDKEDSGVTITNTVFNVNSTVKISGKTVISTMGSYIALKDDPSLGDDFVMDEFGDVLVEGQGLLASDTCKIDGKLTIEYGNAYLLGNDSRFTENGSVEVTLGASNFQYGYLVTNVKAIQNTDVTLSKLGCLTIQDRENNLTKGQLDLNIKQNIFVKTYDEYSVATRLEYDYTGENIANGVRYGGKITGDESSCIMLYNRGISIQKEDPLNRNETNFIVAKDQTTFLGETYVDTGSLILEKNVAYGDVGSGKVLVSGTQLQAAEGDQYAVISCGQMGFLGENTLNAKVLYFQEGSTFSDGDQLVQTIGARLWFNTEGVDSLVTMNASEKITFDQSNTLWYDKISEAGNEYPKTIVLNAPHIEVTNQLGLTEADTHQLGVEQTGTSNEALAAYFAKPLVDVWVTGTGDRKVVTVQAQNADTYAERNQLDENARTGAQMVDYWRNHQTQETLTESLYNTRDQNAVEQTFNNVGRLWGLENVATMQGQIGKVGSQFCNLGMGGMGGSYGMTIRGQELENEVTLENATGNYAGTNRYADTPSGKWMAWGAASYTSIRGEAYEGEKGYRYDGYKVRRAGLIGGLRRQFSETLSGGILFAYSAPELDQSGSFTGVFQPGMIGSYQTHLEMDDFQFAIHFERTLGEHWESSLFIGGGSQSMDWRRTVYDPYSSDSSNHGWYRFVGDTTGNSLTLTAYLARRVSFTEYITLRPTIGFDSEHSWIFGFGETAQDTGNRYMEMSCNQAYSYDKIQYSRNSVRLGISGSYNGPFRRGGLTARIFYGYALGGDDSPMITMTSEDGFTLRDMKGHAMGRHSLNLGLGMFCYLNMAKTLSFSADYNALIYEYATTQNATAGLQWRF
ncbi:MAG: autotransporter outer membrane beta-barrel domain-containing protein [Planctomycetia bacterium]|nr:autotransporter outer membrane beta-barrel domain-containing protein [Planctomycetia bacterium]